MEVSAGSPTAEAVAELSGGGLGTDACPACTCCFMREKCIPARDARGNPLPRLADKKSRGARARQEELNAARSMPRRPDV
jgi:hypothetical protein